MKIRNSAHNTQVTGSVAATALYPIFGTTHKLDTIFTASSIVLDMTGATLYLIACIDILITRRTPNGKKNRVLIVRFRYPLERTVLSVVPSISPINGLPAVIDRTAEKRLHAISIKSTFFMAAVILSFFPAPKFWLVKVAVAVAAVDMGIIRKSYILRDAVWAVMIAVPRSLIAF